MKKIELFHSMSVDFFLSLMVALLVLLRQAHNRASTLEPVPLKKDKFLA